MRVLLVGRFHQFLLLVGHGLGNESINVRAVSVGLACLSLCRRDDVRNVCHRLKKLDSQPLAWKLLAAVHRPKSVLKVVVFHAAECLNVRVSAVVVRYKQSFIGDDFSGATAPELDNSVLQRHPVGIINLFRRKLAAVFLQVLCIHLFEQRQQPHALVRRNRKCGPHHNGQRRQS